MKFSKMKDIISMPELPSLQQVDTTVLLGTSINVSRSKSKQLTNKEFIKKVEGKMSREISQVFSKTPETFS